MPVWYFAYGSNMQSATLRGRRGIVYAQAAAARLPGWRLVFDKPSVLGLPEGFANVVPDPAAETFGVLYELSEDDLAHVDLTEGVLIGNYARIAVAAERLEAPGVAVPAFTLTSDRRDPRVRPSTRYMQLLLAGAEEHGLPAAWIAMLRAVPAGEESPETAQLRPFLDAALAKPRP